MASVKTEVPLDRYGNANSPGLKTCLLDFVGMQEVRWIFEILIVFEKHDLRQLNQYNSIHIMEAWPPVLKKGWH